MFTILDGYGWLVMTCSNMTHMTHELGGLELVMTTRLLGLVTRAWYPSRNEQAPVPCHGRFPKSSLGEGKNDYQVNMGKKEHSFQQKEHD